MNCFVYKWTELSTGMWYIGSRTAKGCHINDGYICSSTIVKPLILAIPNNWKREILETGNRVDMLALEHEILICLGAAKSIHSYNRSNGAGKFNTTGISSWNKGLTGLSTWSKGLTKLTHPSLLKLSESMKGKNIGHTHNLGRIASKESRLNMITAQQNLTDLAKTTKKLKMLATKKKQKKKKLTIIYLIQYMQGV